MKVGLKLVHSGPGATPELMLRWTRYAESLGFHLLMTADHIALTREVLGSYPAPYFEPFTNMAWLAAQTTKMEFGTTVIVVPYRNPLLLAQLCTNIDQLSGGRFIFGIGIGWAASEFDIVGAPHNKRGAMTDDYMQAIEQLWTNPQGASYKGQFISFEDRDSRPCTSPEAPSSGMGWRQQRGGPQAHHSLRRCLAPDTATTRLAQSRINAPATRVGGRSRPTRASTLSTHRLPHQRLSHPGRAAHGG